MFARMISVDEAALQCDFLETYHILDYRALPARQAGLYACGLRDDSRIMQILTGSKTDTETILLAAIADALHILIWQNTQDGHDGKNLPESILAKIQGEKTETNGFDSAAEYEAWHRSMIGGGEDS